jgi:hypothetical protein
MTAKKLIVITRVYWHSKGRIHQIKESEWHSCTPDPSNQFSCHQSAYPSGSRSSTQALALSGSNFCLPQLQTE